jgi:PPOX class probable F420-dependent enzyme
MSGLWALVLAGSVAAAQPAPPQAQASEKERVLTAAAELMRAAGLCALVTLDASGAPQARAMQPFPPEKDLTVWMATNARTRKVGEIRKDPRVTLYYLAPDGTGYVTLRGRATVVDDPAEKAKRWMPAWDAFYEDANRGSDYVLLRVTPSRVEVVSAAHGIAVEPKGWKPAIVDLP